MITIPGLYDGGSTACFSLLRINGRCSTFLCGFAEEPISFCEVDCPNISIFIDDKEMPGSGEDESSSNDDPAEQ